MDFWSWGGGGKRGGGHRIIITLINLLLISILLERLRLLLVSHKTQAGPQDRCQQKLLWLKCWWFQGMQSSTKVDVKWSVWEGGSQKGVLSRSHTLIDVPEYGSWPTSRQIHGYADIFRGIRATGFFSCFGGLIWWCLDYSCIQRLPLAVLRGPCRVPGIEPSLATYNASFLPTELSLHLKDFLCVRLTDATAYIQVYPRIYFWLYARAWAWTICGAKNQFWVGA